MSASTSFPTSSVELRALCLLDRLVPASPQWCIPPWKVERLGWLQFLPGIPTTPVVQLVTGVLTVMTGFVYLTANGRFDSLPEALFVMAIFGASLVLPGYWLLVCFVGGRPVIEVGGYGTALREFPVGLVIRALLMSAVIAVPALLGSYYVVDVGWSTETLVGLGTRVLVEFTEEILSRGILLRLIEGWMGTWWALVITSLLFGISHLGNTHATAFGAVTIALEAGILLGICYLLTRRLWLVIGLHVAWSFVQGGIFGSDISGIGSGRGLTEARFTGPDLFTGRVTGIEASVIAITMCTAAGMAMLLTVRRRGLVVPPR